MNSGCTASCAAFQTDVVTGSTLATVPTLCLIPTFATDVSTCITCNFATIGAGDTRVMNGYQTS